MPWFMLLLLLLLGNKEMPTNQQQAQADAEPHPAVRHARHHGALKASAACHLSPAGSLACNLPQHSHPCARLQQLQLQRPLVDGHHISLHTQRVHAHQHLDPAIAARRDSPVWDSAYAGRCCTRAPAWRLRSGPPPPLPAQQAWRVRRRAPAGHISAGERGSD